MGLPYFIGYVGSTRPQVTYCGADDSVKDHERLAVFLKPGFTGLFFKKYITQPLSTDFHYEKSVFHQRLSLIYTNHKIF